MTRYTIYTFIDKFIAKARMKVSPTGEWIKYSEVEKLLKRLHSDVKKMRDNLTTFPQVERLNGMDYEIEKALGDK